MTKNKSFTLIELLVVIVIIGVLAGIIVVTTTSSIEKANITKSKIFEESIANNLAADMVSKWSLDEVSGSTVPDLWGNNNGVLGDGTCTQGIGTCPLILNEDDCVSGKCMRFDGGDYVRVPGNSSLNLNTFTISVWMKLSSISTATSVIGRSGQLIHYDNVYEATCIGGNGMQLDIGVEECDENMVTDKWYFLVYTRDSLGNYKFYRNSKITINGNNANTGMDTDNNLYIGAYGDLAGLFRGVIDEVKIYSGPILTSTIQEDYLMGLNMLLASNQISKRDYDQRIKELSYE